MISFLARGILQLHLTQGVALNGETLAKCGLGAGRDKCEKALAELRDAGLVELSTMSQGRGKIYKAQSVTEAGREFFKAPIIDALMFRASSHTQSELYHEKVLILSTDISRQNSGKKFPEEKETFMGYDFFKSQGEADDSERSARDLRAEEWGETRDENQRKRQIDRWAKPQAEWGAWEICYEFEERLTTTMRFPAKSLNQKVFVAALTNAWRSQGLKTKGDGEIGVQAMEMFLSGVNLKEFMAADHVALTFVKSFKVLVETVKLSVVSVDDDADARRERKMALVREALKNVQT